MSLYVGGEVKIKEETVDGFRDAIIAPTGALKRSKINMQNC